MIYDKFMGDLWKICGGFIEFVWGCMEELYTIYVGFLEEIGTFREDLWKMFRWFMEDLWGLMEDLWKVYGGFMEEIGLFFRGFMEAF